MPTDSHYKIRLYIVGSSVDIVSPIDTKTFYSELSDSIRRRVSDPEWTGWYLFKKDDDKLIGINVMNIIAVEEI